MSIQREIYLLGYIVGIAGALMGSEDGPNAIRQSVFLKELGPNLKWGKLLQLDSSSDLTKLALISRVSELLAEEVCKLVQDNHFFTVLGGDHTSAIGTWSGASSALKDRGPLGLIWVDAHMDSHTPLTSETGNIHGMPLAALLGYGDKALTDVFDNNPKFIPENVCLIGVRSFEEGEAELLHKLNVRVFFMDEVKQKGLKTVMDEAIRIVSANTAGFGVSLDIDSVDPIDAPGTGCVVAEGIKATDLFDAVLSLAKEPSFVGMEIVEFNPHLDRNQITEKLIVNVLSLLHSGKRIV